MAVRDTNAIEFSIPRNSKTYKFDSISEMVDWAQVQLDTAQQLAAALGDSTLPLLVSFKRIYVAAHDKLLEAIQQVWYRHLDLSHLVVDGSDVQGSNF